MLLDWGVPVDSCDERRRALHLGCAKGSTEVVQELVNRGADFRAIDSEGGRPLDIAVAGKHLQVCKVLLKAGAKLQPNASCKGLADIVEEVQQESIIDELKAFAEDAPDLATELLEADSEVWKAQAAHLRLMALREEQKAGNTLADLQRQFEYESDAYARVKASEEALSRELVDLRVNLQTADTSAGHMKEQLDAAESAQQQSVAQEAEGDVEYRAMKEELSKVQAEKDEAEKGIVQKEKDRADALSSLKELQEEAEQMRLVNKEMSEILKAESAELRGWEHDKEAAAALTAQAHALLGVKA